MLKGTSHAPDETVGTMRPSPPHEAWEYTVEMVAVNTVMAGDFRYASGAPVDKWR